MKTVSNVNLKGRAVLLRADLNSDVKNSKVLMNERIKQSAETIKILKKRKAKIIVIAHQGRPGKNDFVSLRQHAKLLNKYVKIKFIDDIIGKKAETAIGGLKPGQAILLENIRKEPSEFKPSKNNKILKFLKNKIDIYVNDAFSVCHRNQTSMLIPKQIKVKAYAGPLLIKEVNTLKKIKLGNCLYILAGAKPEDNMKLVGKNKVLACGLFGQVCLINKGKKLGEQEKYLKKQKVLIKISKTKLKKVLTPVDFAVLVNGKRKELDLDEFPSKYEIFDIGSETMKLYAKEIKKAKSIYMKGPAGDAAKKGFDKGTFSLLKEISKSKAYSIIGGGHLSDAIDASRIPKSKFGHVSLSGGALLSYIAGEKLPGLEALK